MSISIKHDFYVNDFGGDLSENEFLRVLPDALRHVAWLCDGRTPARCEMYAYKRAVCACCDIFAENGHGPLREYTRMRAQHRRLVGAAPHDELEEELDVHVVDLDGEPLVICEVRVYAKS